MQITQRRDCQLIFYPNCIDRLGKHECLSKECLYLSPLVLEVLTTNQGGMIMDFNLNHFDLFTKWNHQQTFILCHALPMTFDLIIAILGLITVYLSVLQVDCFEVDWWVIRVTYNVPRLYNRNKENDLFLFTLALVFYQFWLWKMNYMWLVFQGLSYVVDNNNHKNEMGVTSGKKKINFIVFEIIRISSFQQKCTKFIYYRSLISSCSFLSSY